MWDIDVANGIFDEGEFLKLIPAGKLGDPNDVGELVVYLSSDAAKYVNGSCITIDGALTSVPLG
jgi:NAD(P)-dependent dehydrogenase (short-subunit alcohol dehydrogenase family)